MKKIYGFPGKTEVVLDLAGGKVKANFKDGRLGTTDDIPAHLETENPIVMAAIENDPRFKAGLMVLMQTYFTPEEQQALAVKNIKIEANGSIKEMKSYPDVKTFEDVVMTLKGLGVPATSLRSKLRAMEAAEELNVEFPNFKD